MFGRNKEQSQRHHTQPEHAGDFDMASYRRGTTLNSFKSNDLTQTERRKLKRLRSLRRRIAAILAVIIVLLILGLSLLSQFTGQLTGAVASNDGVELSESDERRYVDIVNNYFKDNSVERFSFARRNSALLQYVTAQAPEVSDVSLKSSGISSSEVEVTVRQPVAMWINGDKTSYVDNQGIVFERNYYAVPEIAIEDDSGVSLDGNMATSSSFLSFVGRVSTALQDKEGLKVVRVVIPRGSARYAEIYLDGCNYPFKAQITRDSGSQAHDIAVMARYVGSHGIQPQYIDCRVEGKAYWK